MTEPERIMQDKGGNTHGWSVPYYLGERMARTCAGCRSVVLAGNEPEHMEFHRILLDMATELDQRRNA